MSKTELLNPIAKYYIIDSQSGYKQNVSLEQNHIQKLEKLFYRAGTAALCPAWGAEDNSLPLALLFLTPTPSLPPSFLHTPAHTSAPGLHCEQSVGQFWGAAYVS